MTERTVRVLHVITRLDLGGAQDNTLYTVGHLRPPYEPSLVCGPGGLLDGEAREMPGVRVTFVPSLVREIHPARDLLALARLVRIFRKERPHIVHTHSSKAGVLGRIAARLTRVPVVVHSIHGFGFNREQPAPLRASLIAAERTVAPITTHFIAVSRANLEEGIALGIIPAGRASLIRSGIRLDRFEAAGAERARHREAVRSETGIPPGAPVAGLIACLKPQKSPLDFVEAAALVARRVPEAFFLVAGDGDLRGAVRERARALGIGDRVRLLGWRRDVPRILASLDVMLLTSSWEGLPRVLPEAIAVGIPIVATAVDGANDILADGRNAVVRRAHDREGLAEGVIRILRDPGFGLGLASCARACLGEFDIDRMVRAQEALYGDLIDRHLRRARGDATRAGARATAPPSI